MNQMNTLRALFYPVRAWMDVMGGAAPEPFRSVINAYFADRRNSALRLQVMQIHLGVWTGEDSTRVQEQETAFWNRLKILVESQADIDPTPLGAPMAIQASTEFRNISGLILARYRPAGETARAVSDVETGSNFTDFSSDLLDNLKQQAQIVVPVGGGLSDPLIAALLASASASAAAAAAAASSAALAAALLVEAKKSQEEI